MFTDDERHKLQLNEENSMRLKVGIRLKWSCIPPVNTESHGGQISVHSISQHRVTWWSDRKLVRREARYKALRRSLSYFKKGGKRRSSIIIRYAKYLEFPKLCVSTDPTGHKRTRTRGFTSTWWKRYDLHLQL